MFDYYTSLIVYPASLAILILGSFVVYASTRRISALVQAIGFVLALAGYLFVNFGPRQTTFTEKGDAVIEYTQLFSIGVYLGQMGIAVAALAFLAFAWKIRNKPLVG